MSTWFEGDWERAEGESRGTALAKGQSSADSTPKSPEAAKPFLPRFGQLWRRVFGDHLEARCPHPRNQRCRNATRVRTLHRYVDIIYAANFPVVRAQSAEQSVNTTETSCSLDNFAHERCFNNEHSMLGLPILPESSSSVDRVVVTVLYGASLRPQSLSLSAPHHARTTAFGRFVSRSLSRACLRLHTLLAASGHCTA